MGHPVVFLSCDFVTKIMIKKINLKIWKSSLISGLWFGIVQFLNRNIQACSGWLGQFRFLYHIAWQHWKCLKSKAKNRKKCPFKYQSIYFSHQINKNVILCFVPEFNDKNHFRYRVSHLKLTKVILLWWRYRLWFLLILWILCVP